jgi:hypothetical protein
MKNLVKIITPLIMGTSFLTTNLEAQKNTFMNEQAFRIEYERSPVSISTIPLIIRDVPKHKDDTYAPNKNVAPIEDISGTLDGPILLGDVKMEYRRRLSKEDMTIDFGKDIGKLMRPKSDFKIGWSFEVLLPESFGQNRNYTNAPGTHIRGEGAALTFYTVSRRYVFKLNNYVRPKLFTEMEFMNKKRSSFAFGYEVFPEKIIARNGWDRYDRKQTKDRYALSNLYYGKAYISARTHGKRFGRQNQLTFGFVHLLSYKNTELGNEAGINPSKMGFSIGLKSHNPFNTKFE